MGKRLQRLSDCWVRLGKLGLAGRMLPVVLLAGMLSAQQDQVLLRQIPLPTSKRLIGSSPGVMGELNGFTPTIALSPDKHYAAFVE